MDILKKNWEDENGDIGCITVDSLPLIECPSCKQIKLKARGCGEHECLNCGKWYRIIVYPQKFTFNEDKS